MARRLAPATLLAQQWETTSALVALLSPERELLYLNRAAATCLGGEPEAFVGQIIPLAHQAVTRQGTGRIAPPAAAFTGTLCSGTIYRDESAQPDAGLPALFVPIPSDGTYRVLMLAHELLAFPQSEPPWQAALKEALAHIPPATQELFLLGQSPSMNRVRAQWRELVLPSTAAVTIVAPAGTGAEMIAARLVASRDRTAPAPIALDCAVHSSESVHDWLRSLTRLARSVPLAEQTLLLKDVSRLAPEAQAELLHWLRSQTAGPRIVATSSRSLLRDGACMPELAAMLSVLVLRWPPLRKRVVDLPLLVQWLIEDWNAKRGTLLQGCETEALDRIVAYRWPGELDELTEVVRNACARAQQPWITAANLPEQLHSSWEALAYPRTTPATVQLDTFLADTERELLRRAMQAARQNKSRAATLLGVSRQRLVRRLIQLGLLTAAEEPIDFQPLEPPSGKEP